MYQSYISGEGIVFARHYGHFEGAEGFKAFLSALEANPPVTQLQAVCVDLRDVTAATLEDSDRANVTFFKRQFARYGQQLDSMLLVRVKNAKSVAINKIFLERDARTAGPFLDLGAAVTVYSAPEALEVLGLPADYRIEYPAKN